MAASNRHINQERGKITMLKQSLEEIQIQRSCSGSTRFHSVSFDLAGNGD
jgi:hypothetical protein